MAGPFVDTNIFLRHLRNDDPTQSPRCTAFFVAIAAGETRAVTSATVVFETVFTLQRRFQVARADIAATVLPLIELAGLKVSRKRMYRAVFELYVRTSLSFADAYHAVLVRELKLSEIMSFDQGFDRVTWLTRTEPPGI